MAVKSGQILHVANDVTLIERLQTAGPGNLNIPKDRIFELGNYQSVGTIRDIPDLTFSMESLDVSVALEAVLTSTPLNSGSFDLSTCRALDMATPVKPGKDAANPFQVVKAVALPFLYPEQISYRFGLRDNAQQTVQLRGDSIYYCPGPVYVQSTVAGIAAGGTLVTANPAGVYTETGVARRILSVEAGNVRLSLGVDYTVSTPGTTAFETATVTFVNAVPAGTQVRVVYFSNTNKQYPQSVHTLPSVKPAAIRGRDIDVYFGGYDPLDIPGSQLHKWSTVQSANVDWRVTLDADEEFGSYYRTSSDFEVPDVSGSVTIKPRSVDDLFDKLRKATGVSTVTEAVGPALAPPGPLDIVLKNPTDGSTLKRLHIPDARLTIPGYSPRVQQKLTVDMPFDSDGGTLIVYDD